MRVSLKYFFDKLRLCKALGFDLEEIKKQVASGIRSRDLSVSIMSRSYSDTNAMLRGILEFESVDATRRQRYDSLKETTRPFDANKRTSQRPATKTTSVDVNQKPVQDASSSREVKYNSDSPEVRSDVECFRCHKTGHLAKNCPIKPKKIIKSETNVISTNSNEDTCKKYVKDIEISGFRVSAFIDPGSSDSLIKESVVEKLKFLVIDLSNMIEGFGGGEVLSEGVVRESVTIDSCRVDNLQLRIVKDIAQRYDIIIGRDFTDRSELAFYRYGNCFEFVYSKDFPFIQFPEANVESAQAVAPIVLNSMCLPPASTNFISVKCNDMDEVIPVTNLSKEPVNIKAGQVLETKIKRDKIEELEPRVEPVTECDLAEGMGLSDERLLELLELLNKYRMCIALKMSELGCTHLIEMDIEEKPGSVPPVSKPYMTTTEKREIIKNKVTEWKAHDIVKETNATYASPCVLVQNANGSYRLVFDYRRLNKNTVRMNFPMPNVDDGLEALYGATIFAVLDMALGYL